MIESSLFLDCITMRQTGDNADVIANNCNYHALHKLLQCTNQCLDSDDINGVHILECC